MINTLIQTVANLGFDSAAISAALNKALETIRNGDTSSLQGISEIFTGIVSALTGASIGDVNAVLTSLVTSIVAILSDDSTSSVLSTITGA